jgi:HlyD family secretion protein
MKKKYWIVAALVILVIGGYFVYRGVQQRAESVSSQYQTEKVVRGNLEAIVGATGTVHSNQSTEINWETTGVIGEIPVEIDDKVRAQDLLATLERNSLPQNIILAEADLITAKRNLENLKDSEKAAADAELARAQAQIALDDAIEYRERKDFARASQTTLDALKADFVLAQDGLDNAEDLFSYFEDKPENDPGRASAMLQYVNAKNARDRSLSNLNYALGRPDSQEIAEADAKIEVADANLKDAEREWERLKDGVDPQDIAAAEARVEAIQSTLDMAFLKAPFAGTITEVNSKIGDQVTPATQTFRIDDLSRLLIDVEVPEVDINRVKIGQPVEIVFDAILNKTFNGVVSEVSRVGKTDQGVVNFMVTIELQDADQDVLTGMTAAVNILTSQLNDVLLVPNRAVRFKDGKRIVYKLLDDGSLEEVPVQIGATSDTNSEIIQSDIKEGDTLVLNPPVEFRSGPPSQ